MSGGFGWIARAVKKTIPRRRLLEARKLLLALDKQAARKRHTYDHVIGTLKERVPECPPALLMVAAGIKPAATVAWGGRSRSRVLGCLPHYAALCRELGVYRAVRFETLDRRISASDYLYHVLKHGLISLLEVPLAPTSAALERARFPRDQGYCALLRWRLEEARFYLAEYPARKATLLRRRRSTYVWVVFGGRRGLVDRLLAVGDHPPPERVAEVGRLLGYPPCCVQAYLQEPARPASTDRLYNISFGSRPPPNVHELPPKYEMYLEHAVCSDDCGKSKRIATRVRELLLACYR